MLRAGCSGRAGGGWGPEGPRGCPPTPSLAQSEPIGRRLNRVVRRVVGEVEEERLMRLCTLAEIVARPLGEDVGCMSLRIDDLPISPHEIDAVAKVRPVVVHHVAEEAVEELFAETIRLGGTLSGEHGIGLSKAPYLGMELSDLAMQTMKKIKQLFDPNNIMNPGKIFPA